MKQDSKLMNLTDADYDFYLRSEQYRDSFYSEDSETSKQEKSKIKQESEEDKKWWKQNLYNEEYWNKTEEELQEAIKNCNYNLVWALEDHINERNRRINSFEEIREEEEDAYEKAREWCAFEAPKMFVLEMKQAKEEFEAYTGLTDIQPEDPDFNTYYVLRKNGDIKFQLCKYKNRNVRVCVNYKITGTVKSDPAVYTHIKKKHLPAKVFDYLIRNGIIREIDFGKFSMNQFERTFESKMGDIVFEKDYPAEESRQKHYDKLDCSEFKNSDFKGVIYVSNQWSEKSIERFISYIHKNYGKYVNITNPAKELTEKLKKRINKK